MNALVSILTPFAGGNLSASLIFTVCLSHDDHVTHICSVLMCHLQEVISLVRSCGLQLESQVGRSVGYRQALKYLKAVWGFSHECGSSETEDHVYVAQVRSSTESVYIAKG